MWPRWATGTPTLPTSPRAERVVGVVAGLGGQVEGDRQAGLPLGQVGAVELVRGLGRRVARVGAHHPRLVAVVYRRRSVMRHSAPYGSAHPDDRQSSGPTARTSAAPLGQVGQRVGQELEVVVAGTSTAPSDARWSVRHCTSSRRSLRRRRASTLDQADQRHLRRVGAAVEHRLAGEQAADGHAVEAAGQRAVVERPGLDAVRPAEVGAA